MPFEKDINIHLVYSSCLKHANEMLLGDPRQVDQRTQSFHFAIVIHQSLDPAARSSAQAPSSLSLHALRALDRLRTRRRVGSTRRRGNHMHDHWRFQRDIDDVTGVSLSTTHKSHSRTIIIGSTSALPIMTPLLSACAGVITLEAQKMSKKGTSLRRI